MTDETFLDKALRFSENAKNASEAIFNFTSMTFLPFWCMLNMPFSDNPNTAAWLSQRWQRSEIDAHRPLYKDATTALEPYRSIDGGRAQAIVNSLYADQAATNNAADCPSFTWQGLTPETGAYTRVDRDEDGDISVRYYPNKTDSHTVEFSSYNSVVEAPVLLNVKDVRQQQDNIVWTETRSDSLVLGANHLSYALDTRETEFRVSKGKNKQLILKATSAKSGQAREALSTAVIYDQQGIPQMYADAAGIYNRTANNLPKSLDFVKSDKNWSDFIGEGKAILHRITGNKRLDGVVERALLPYENTFVQPAPTEDTVKNKRDLRL